MRDAGLAIVLLFVGLGGALFCYLFLRSRYVPALLAVWGIVTYVSMTGLGLVQILWPGHPSMIETILYGSGGAFEVLFGLWLLFRGVRLEHGAQAGSPA